MEYASKGLAGTALGFGIGGAAMSLANGGLGNLLGGLNQNKRSEVADVAAARSDLVCRKGRKDHADRYLCPDRVFSPER